MRLLDVGTRRKRPMPLRKRALFAKLLLSILTTLFGVEILLRIVTMIPMDSALYINDAEVGFRMRPGVLGPERPTNSLGFNDEEHPLQKSPGEIRLAFVGDSFVFGAVPREVNFVAALNVKAAEEGRKLRTLNMGIPGAGPYNYLALIQHDARKMDADIVGVLLFVGNDVTESHPDFKSHVCLGQFHHVLRRPYLVGTEIDYCISCKSYRAVLRLIRERFHDGRSGTFSRASFLEIERQRARVFLRSERAYMAESYANALVLFREVAETAEKLGMELFVVLAPDEVQVVPALQQELVAEFDLDLSAYDWAKPQRYFRTHLNRAGIPVVDLLPVFQGAASSEVLYLKQDTHWNARGNQLAAEQIWSFLRERKLVKQAEPARRTMGTANRMYPSDRRSSLPF